MTELCYLDGRYIDLALGSDPRYAPRPLIVNIVPGPNGKTYGTASMEHVNFRDPSSCLIRVIIQTPQSRHSNALLLAAENGRIKAYRFDPFPGGPYHEFVNTLLREYLKQTLQVDFADASAAQADVKGGCYGSGFCAAYVLKWFEDSINGRDFDGSNIRNYAQGVVNKYGSIDGPVVLDNPDVEYGWYYGPGYGYGYGSPYYGRPYYGSGYGFSPGGALVGGLGGAVIGGAVGGPVGALAGGTLGAVAGGALF